MKKGNKEAILRMSSERFSVCAFLITFYVALWVILPGDNYELARSFAVCGAGFAFIYILSYANLLGRPSFADNDTEVLSMKTAYKINLLYAWYFILYMFMDWIPSTIPDWVATAFNDWSSSHEIWGKIIKTLLILLQAVISLIFIFYITKYVWKDDEYRKESVNKRKRK